jgi:hypothetical protein
MSNENMTHQSQKQKDVYATSKIEESYMARQNEGDGVGSRTLDTSYRGPRHNLTITAGTTQPTLTRMPKDNHDSKEPGTGHENGFVDAPGAEGNANTSRADAERDASPNQKATLIDGDQSRDA